MRPLKGAFSINSHPEIDILATELSQVMDITVIPSNWDDDWLMVPIDNPEQLRDDSYQAQPDQGDLNPLLEAFATVAQGTNRIVRSDLVPAEARGIFPGGFRREQQESIYPPPDAFAFYLPFHFFYPTWWGIYLLHEGVLELAQILSDLSEAKLDPLQYAEAARIFLFGHEQFHHEVESFATRLEVTHRRPLYKLGFEYDFSQTYGTDDCLEEALANAHGLRRLWKAFARHPALPILRKAFGEYIPRTPPGYRRGLEFVGSQAFEHGRCELAELRHECALNTARIAPQIWEAFPHGFHPFRRRNSRVNFLVHRDTTLGNRLTLSGRFFRYRDVVKQVEEVAGCTYIGTKGSHVHFRAPHGGRVTVPRHPGDLKAGTLASIVRQTGIGMNVQQFMKAEAVRASAIQAR